MELADIDDISDRSRVTKAIKESVTIASKKLSEVGEETKNLREKRSQINRPFEKK